MGRSVIPIYNNPNSEAVPEKAGYGHIVHKVDAFGSFPDTLDTDGFRDRMASCDGTNMESIPDRITGRCPDYQ